MFLGSRSFKVIDVDIRKKLLISACYDKQYGYAYLQPFTRQTSTEYKSPLFTGVPLVDTHVRRPA